MASGEPEPLQYTTTVLRVSIHCEGCKKKVRKVLLGIEGVYKVTIDAAQHKVTVTGSVAADALVRRLLKSGKPATLWPVPAPAAAEGKKKKSQEVAAEPSAGESGKGADKAGTKPKKVAEEAEPESSEKKPEKGKSSEKKPDEDKISEKKAEAKKLKDDVKEREVPEKKEKGSPEPAAKEASAEEAGGEQTGGKKGKKKNKQKDAGGDGDAAAEKPSPSPPQQQPKTKPQPQQVMPPVQGPDRAHGGAFPYYPPQPVMSYNMAQPSASVSYYAPTAVVSMQPMPPPPHIPYGYSPYPPMMMPPPPPEFMYGPPGMRSSPPQESYNNMFNEENPNSCSLM